MLHVIIHVYVIDINACKSSPCHHDGGCVKLGKKFACTCQTEYVGITCSGMYCAILVSFNFRSTFHIMHDRLQTHIHFR